MWSPAEMCRLAASRECHGNLLGEEEGEEVDFAFSLLPLFPCCCGLCDGMDGAKVAAH